jgi:hypothetical protein
MNDIIDRVRAANPIVPTTAGDAELFDRLVARPGDPRLQRARRDRRRWAIAAVAVALVAVGAGAGWAAVNEDPVSLFRSNPQMEGSDPRGLWRQQVIPSSVRRVGSAIVPGEGRVAFWYGETRQGGWCGALRAPDGGWLGTPGVGAGGIVPGCFPTRAQVNDQDQVYVLNGFDYGEDDIDLRATGGGFWRITFGRVTGLRPAARVVNVASGTSAHVAEGTLFVIALRDPDPSRPFPVHLVAYDRAGKVVADERKPLSRLRQAS